MSDNVEEWRSIKGFEGLYSVSNLGQVKSHLRGAEKILRTRGRDGYCSAVLYKDGKGYGKRVHRLVAEAFIPNPDNKPFIDHIDTDASNNRFDNLRWVTQKENCNNPLTREHNSKSRIGKKFALGHHHTEETKKKMSDAHKGKNLSEEHKRKLSEAHKGKPRHFSDEHRRRLSESRKGIQFSEETRKNMSEAHKGTKLSEEHKNRISESLKARYALKDTKEESKK